MKTDFEDCDAEMTFIDKTPEYKELCETVHQICVKQGGCMGAYDYIILLIVILIVILNYCMLLFLNKSDALITNMKLKC